MTFQGKVVAEKFTARKASQITTIKMFIVTIVL